MRRGTLRERADDAAPTLRANGGWRCDVCGITHATRTVPADSPGWLCDACTAIQRSCADGVRGLVFGGYECVRLLAEGGMGRVYEAHHIGTQTHAAVKVLLPQASASPNAIPRFLRAQRLAWSLQHARIVETFEVGRSGPPQKPPSGILAAVLSVSFRRRLLRNFGLRVDRRNSFLRSLSDQ